MWRRTLIITAVLVGVMAGVVVGLSSERVADNLRQRAIAFARQSFGLEVQIARLDLEFLPLGVGVEGLRVRRPEESADWIRVHRGSLQIRPWPSSAGAVVIESLEVDGLFLDLRQIENAEAEDSTDTDWQVDVRDVALWNAQILTAIPNGSADLQQIDFRMAPQSRGGRALDLRIGRGVVDLGGDIIDLEAQVRADFEGTVDRPRSLQLTQARIDLPLLALEADGTAQLDLPVPEVDIDVGADVKLAQIGELISGLPALGGRARPTIRLRGPVDRPEIRLEVESEEVTIARSDIGNVAVDAVYAGDRVLIEAFELLHPRGGRVTGSGSVGFEDGYPMTASARLHGVKLEEVLASSGLRDAWVRMGLNGDLRATGSLAPLGIEVALDGDVDRFEVLGASHARADSRRFLVLNDVPLRGQAAVTRDLVLINGFELGPEGNRYDVEGMVHYRDGLDLRVRSEQTDLEWFGPVASIPFEGKGEVTAAIEGPFKHPIVTANTSVASLSILGFNLGDTDGTLVYDDPFLKFEQAQIVRPSGGEISGAGRLRFEKPLIYVEAAADISDVELSDAMEDLKLPADFARRIESRGSGRVIVGGTLEGPEGVLHVDSKRAQFDGVDLGALDLEVGFGSGKEKLWVEVGLVRETSLIDTRTAFRSDDTLSLRGQFANVPLPTLRKFVGDAPIAGTTSGRFDLVGRTGTYVGTASAQIRDFEALGARFEKTKIRAQIKEGEASVEGSLLGGDLLAAGKVRLAGKFPFNLSATFKDLEGTRLIDLGDQVKTQLTGSFFSQGSILEPSKVIADFRMDRWVIQAAEEQLSSMRTISMQWGSQTLIVPDAGFVGPDMRFLVSGQVPLQGPMRLRISGDGSLNALALMTDRVSRGRGQTRFNVEIGGTIAEPVLDGELAVENGELALRGSNAAATKIQARMTFSGAAADIDYARFRYGNGDVRLGGQLVFGGVDSEVSLRSDFERVRLRPTPGLNTTLSGNLRLLGRLDDLRLRGDVEIDELIYDRNVDLASLIPRRRSSSMAVPAIEASEVIDLAVKVSADNNLRVANNVLDAEFRAELTVTGTTNRVGLLGTVTPLAAKARYAGNVFTLERGSVDFTEEYEIFSRFNLQATTEACSMDVSVEIYGDSESYNHSPSGSDESGPVDPQDVLVCLQFGSRVRDFATDGTAQTSTAVGGV
ncbi:MAG: translocation/assembly module TamB domain-containing protein, partial [Myxococcota bacterium]